MSASSGKRQHLVDTAYALFKREGFHVTGIDRILAEADVAKMTLYRHFPSKDDLIVAVLEHRAALYEVQLDRLLGPDGAPEDRIAALFDWYGRWFRREDFHGCLFAHAIAEYGEEDHPVHLAARRQKAHVRERIAAILTEDMPAPRADELSSALLMLLEGAAMLAQMGPGDEAIRAARAAALTLIRSETARL